MQQLEEADREWAGLAMMQADMVVTAMANQAAGMPLRSEVVRRLLPQATHAWSSTTLQVPVVTVRC